MKTKSNHSRTASAIARYGVSVLALVATGAAMPALAQEAAPAAAPSDNIETVVVTGFRSSLQSSMSAKKQDLGIVDVITAEDIADFPDNNLAESLQRIPGIAIDRDGGEGRTITVRGLGPTFTRVRINGLEALATVGGKDSTGANLDRGFDFNVFASELFRSLTVRKSQSAEVDEGSLGATVDLQASRPFDYKGFTMAAGAQAQYNDRSKDTSPRVTFLISNRWADGKLGALLSVAYSERNIFEEGPSTVRWENAVNQSSGARFQSFSTDGGTTFTSIPVSGTLTGEALKVTNALHPRIPRYGRLSYDQKRLGVTGAFQMRPNPNTLVTIEGMYSKFRADRTEQYLEVLSFSRGGQGNPQTDIYNYTISDTGVITKASFNDVDVRSEMRFDDQSSEFAQVNVIWDQNWSDSLKTKLLIGSSKSVQNNPRQTTLSYEAYDVDGYSYDFSDRDSPVFNYSTKNGCKVDQACYWTYSSASTLGDASLVRIRPNKTTNIFKTVKFDAEYAFNSDFKLKAGLATKGYEFDTMQRRRANENVPVAAATYINANFAALSDTVSAFGTSWLVPNVDRINAAINYECNCVNTYGDFTTGSSEVGGARGFNREASERDNSAFVQLDFRTELAGLPVFGNLGVRYVETNQKTSGYLTATSYVTVERTYEDTLPALNLSIQPLRNVYIRLAAAKTMARPLLGNLTPGGTLNTATLTYTGGNPYLDPFRSDNIDLNFEWYPDRDTLVTLGLFRKDISSYIQNFNYTVPYSELGLPLSFLPNGQTASTNYVVTTPVSTPGGELKGWEFSVQKPFTFLPGLLRHTGGIFNYTQVESQIAYLTSTTSTATRTADLLGMSPKSWNATLYYEDEKLSARVSAAYRSKYLTNLLPGSGADFQGKNETLNFDMSASYQLSKNITLTFEGINLTDEADDRYNMYNQAATGNTEQNALLEYTQSGRSFLVGIRYKY